MPMSTWPRADQTISGSVHAFLSDTVLLTGVGFEAAVEQPVWGVCPAHRLPECQGHALGSCSIAPSTPLGMSRT